MSKINYKSDFDFTLRIYECTVGPDGQKTRVEMGFPTYDFEIRLYTTNRANAYICSKKGNKLQNCFNDEGKIHVVCDNHHLGKGVLHAEFTAFLPNNIYPDGSRKTVEVSHTVIELVDGSGDSPSIDDLKLTPAFVSDQGEALRVEAENKRVEAEAERKAAEAQRAKDFEAIKQEVAVEDRIGIFPFNSIVEAHSSVSDDAPDYATQFPSTADGAYRHIIFDKSRGTFLWEIHAGDYPDCPAGDAYTSWNGSAEYVSEGHPRTDRLYRLANELYRWDGTTLRSYSAAITAQQDALDALRTRVSTNEGNIYTNADDIATLQDDLQSVADLCQDNYEDIGRLKENVSQITQIVDENRELQNSQGETIATLQGGLGEAQNELGELSQLLVDYEDDAALKLSEAEMRLGGRIDAVGILPFNTIVEAHNSVSDGAPDYATQFPSAADGAYRHIIFDKSRGTFLWEIHAGDYPNCPAGDAYNAWTGSEEYLSEGHPRTDRLYRMGNELYRWDGTALVSYSEELATKADRTELSNIVGTPSEGVIEDLEPTLVTEALRKTAQTLTPAEQAQVKKNIGVSKMELFIDMWNAEGSYCLKTHARRTITAKYDPENAPDMAHPFVCNGLWLTYDEALDVYNHRLTRGTIRTGALRGSHVRTALCAIHSFYAENFSLDWLFYGAANLEIARISTNDLQGIWVNDMTGTFSNCRKLREIVPAIVDVVKANYYPAWMNTFFMCDSLVSVKIKGLTHSLVFRDSPLLSLDSISFMVTNAANTSPITITVHKDVFAKLTDESNTEWNQVLTDATNKNITFATL